MTTDTQKWSESGLRYELDAGVAWLRLDRPRKRNAIDRPLRTALLAAIDEASTDPRVRAAVITGTGAAFSSGADLTQDGGPIELPPERHRDPSTVARDDGLSYGWYRLMERIWRSEKTFIAGVNGIAAGGGCQLALSCDLIIASDQASFWEVFVQRGLPLEGGGAWILPKLTSLVRAKELALLGQPLSATEAERWGLVNRVVPHADFEATLAEWAANVAALPTVRLGQIKSQLNWSYETGMLASFREEATLLGVSGGADGHEAMQAYAQRREPRYTGS